VQSTDAASEMNEQLRQPFIPGFLLQAMDAADYAGGLLFDLVFVYRCGG